MILEWARKFELSFDPMRLFGLPDRAGMSRPQWLQETFPYRLDLDEKLVSDKGENGLVRYVSGVVTFASFQPPSSLHMVNSFAARFPIYWP